MEINQGTNLDMTTLADEDSTAPYKFTKEFGAQDPSFSYLYQTNNGKTQIDYPENCQKDNARIANLQSYFKNPSELLSSITDGLTYDGPIDGIINSELRSFVKHLEKNISNIINSDEVFGIILSTDPEDIEDALKHLVKFDKIQVKKIAKNRDERLYKIAKLLIDR